MLADLKETTESYANLLITVNHDFVTQLGRVG